MISADTVWERLGSQFVPLIVSLPHGDVMVCLSYIPLLKEMCEEN